MPPRILPITCLFRATSKWKGFSPFWRKEVLLKLKINVKVKTIFNRKGTFSFMIAAYLVILTEEVR